MEKINSSTGTNKYSDHDRLKTLYSISKKLSVFKNVEESFEDIVSCAAESFPLVSAVLIEHWEKIPRTAVWFTAGASKVTVAKALLNAKANYSYLAGASILESSNFLKEFSSEIEFPGNDNAFQEDNNTENYIVLPLMIDNLPPLGPCNCKELRHSMKKTSNL